MSAICGALCTLYTAPYDDSSDTRCNISHISPYHRSHPSCSISHIPDNLFIHYPTTIPYKFMVCIVHIHMVVELSKKELAGLLEDNENYDDCSDLRPHL